ncbi:Hypothetical protein ORPV_848 [Orpheovirus IHUMI-LCC2]|uniref:Uncharacterized protein n=1 Tax=Orpheovirus IHUMI-LCC2 TaxID=2023057 RepID=A0A2I2L5C9_9VIRU|nr:Hypothetical protein ORPV_848 [Orpheovirus IHUMI-LCC2]SNW62752.1 Hypothetical protein ORPV_848 [Orpheovirus IHUMI-LCC2]
MLSLSSIALDNYIQNNATDSDIDYLHKRISEEAQKRKDKRDVVQQIDKLFLNSGIDAKPLRGIIYKISQTNKTIYCGDYDCGVYLYTYYISIIYNINLCLEVLYDTDCQRFKLTCKVFLNGEKIGYEKQTSNERNNQSYNIYIDKDKFGDLFTEETLTLLSTFITLYIKDCRERESRFINKVFIESKTLKEDNSSK